MIVRLIGLEKLPLIEKGDDLSQLIVDSVQVQGCDLKEGDIVVIAETVVSKSEGNYIELDSLEPSLEAEELARKTGKDASLMEAILKHSQEIVKVGKDFIVTETEQGFVCANAGIDESNVKKGCATPLPHNPDQSAAYIRNKIESKLRIKIGVIISDTQGRPFREGAVGVAVGSSGIKTLWDLTGKKDLYGQKLQTTKIAIADELAASASLLMGQANEGVPAVIIRGYDNFHLLKDPNANAQQLLRPKKYDVFR